MWRGWVTDLEGGGGFTMVVGFESGGRLSVVAKYEGRRDFDDCRLRKWRGWW